MENEKKSNKFRFVTDEEIKLRKASGFRKSPYSFKNSVRYFANYATKGYFSYENEDLLFGNVEYCSNKGRIEFSKESDVDRTIKIGFIGDIMITKSGSPRIPYSGLKETCKELDIIICNIEGNVIDKEGVKRGFMQFDLGKKFCEELFELNPSAKWIFGIANNHLFDNSLKEDDYDEVKNTIKNLSSIHDSCSVCGINLEGSDAEELVEIDLDGLKIGVICWTDIMNDDYKHFQKRVVRGNDLNSDRNLENFKKIKDEYNFVIGFGHGNEEHSLHPLKETRDRWKFFLEEGYMNMIVGHGPHVVLPAEIIKGKHLLLHSIGNFCSPIGHSLTRVGLFPVVSLNCNKNEIVSVDYSFQFFEQEGEKLIKGIKTLKARERLETIWFEYFNENVGRPEKFSRRKWKKCLAFLKEKLSEIESEWEGKENPPEVEQRIKDLEEKIDKSEQKVSKKLFSSINDEK